MTNWNANVQAMRTFLDDRCVLITGKLDTCLDLNPQELKLDVTPAGSGTIALNGSVKSPYVWDNIIVGDSVYTLKATPTGGQYWAFDYWEKQSSANNFLPNSTTALIQYDFKKKDSVVAHFKYFNYDSVNVTFDVTPPGTGSILLNGTLISSYPTTITLDRRFPYTIAATPLVNHNFVTWQKNNANTTIAPSMTDKVATLHYLDQETVVAEFVYVPPPPPPPPLPLLTAVDTSQVFIPNVFSPNGDGTNDLFSMRVGKDVTGIEMMIYDRWGKLVYQTNNLNKGWNGSYNGKDAEIGVYQYLIKVKYRDASVSTFKGDVTLLR
jgi:gliding motility-associated-like protein